VPLVVCHCSVESDCCGEASGGGSHHSLRPTIYDIQGQERLVRAGVFGAHVEYASIGVTREYVQTHVEFGAGGQSRQPSPGAFCVLRQMRLVGKLPGKNLTAPSLRSFGANAPRMDKKTSVGKKFRLYKHRTSKVQGNVCVFTSADCPHRSYSGRR